MEAFSEEIKRHTEEVERLLQAFLPKETGMQQEIFEAMNYSVLAGGKRLRPILLLESYRLFGGTPEEEETLVAPFLAALEMIHSYSLVHDDLPAMDNDRYRRGKLTTHAVYGEAMGILAGDALLNYAFETAARAFLLEEEAAERRMDEVARHNARAMRAMRILADKAGAYGMVGGQVVDVKKTGQALTEEELLFIYRLKTGALLEASLVIGAVLAGADAEEQAQMEQIAANVGLAFQIQDDILDETSTLEELGKPIHSDAKNQKTTYVTLFGLETAKESVRTYTEAATARLDALPRKNRFLRELLLSLITRKK